jgi:hypothetical protein
MAGICTYVPPLFQAESESERSYTINCFGDLEGIFENYTLIPVERTGFVVIKQVISLDDWDDING